MVEFEGREGKAYINPAEVTGLRDVLMGKTMIYLRGGRYIEVSGEAGWVANRLATKEVDREGQG